MQRLFPEHFKNFIFLSVGEVDAQSYDGQGALRTLRYEIENSLRYYVNFCHSHGLAAKSYLAFGTDPVQELIKLSDQVYKEFPNSVCFASKLIFAHESFFTRWLHNQTALAIQQRLTYGPADGDSADESRVKPGRERRQPFTMRHAGSFEYVLREDIALDFARAAVDGARPRVIERAQHVHLAPSIECSPGMPPYSCAVSINRSVSRCHDSIAQILSIETSWPSSSPRLTTST